MVLGIVLIVMGFIKGKSITEELIFWQNSINFILLGLGSLLVSLIWAVFAVIIKLRSDYNSESDD